MPIEISPITEQDIPGAITCIQEAFNDDPYANWVFDKPTFSKERNAHSLSLRIRWGMTHALFHVAKDSSDPSKVLGVACWLPPQPASASETWHSWLGGLWLSLSQLHMNLTYGRGGLNLTRYYIWKRQQAAAQAALWDDEAGYYFCNIVTVLPSCQGMGVGGKLVRYVTAEADARGRKCYLESSRAEPNAAIYGRLGFEVVREMRCEEGGQGVTLYCMMREPWPQG